MANISPSVLKQASRLATKASLSSAARRNANSFTRVASTQVSRAPSRSYVSETKRNEAQIADTKIETAIRLDKKVIEKAGLSLNAQDGSNQSVSPMAGRSSPSRIRRLFEHRGHLTNPPIRHPKVRYRDGRGPEANLPGHAGHHTG